MSNNSNDIDSVLIDKAKNGNEGAFKILVNKYYPRVYSSLFSFTKSKEDSEDLTQHTFIKVLQQLDTFRGYSAFFTWVYTLLYFVHFYTLSYIIVRFLYISYTCLLCL